MPFLFGQPAPVPKNAYYGLPTDDRYKTDVEVVTGKVEHKFDDIFSISDTARYGSYWFDARETNAHYGTANCYTTAPYAGAPLCATTANPAPATTINPLFPVDGTPLNQIFVAARPAQLRRHHRHHDERDRPHRGFLARASSTIISPSACRLDKEDADLTRFANQNTVIVPTPLLAPNPYEAFPGHQTTSPASRSPRPRRIGTYVVDNIDIGAQWSVVGAIRFDHFGANYNQPVGTATHFTHNDNIGSPRVALVYKPTENSSVYFSYGTSFNPSAETLSLSASNQGLGPERDHTFEVGGKIDVLDGLLALTAAAFNTVMTNARISDPDNPGLQELAGTERVNGVEFGAQGHITENWELTAGYTYLAPRAVGLIAAGVPGPIPNVAHDQANLWTVYDWDFGLKTGARPQLARPPRGRRRHRQRSRARSSTAQMPSYVTVDAMVAYPVTDKFSLHPQRLQSRQHLLLHELLLFEPDGEPCRAGRGTDLPSHREPLCCDRSP